ncbi:serine-rich protein [Lentinula edodes]|uniref:Serine-rich protein n=1 Tax=Lentinula edodes TaxID=5353 RepID=A0A1Q3EP81_LENED|nr:serine-rich protein [Lentinula edodes]
MAASARRTRTGSPGWGYSVRPFCIQHSELPRPIPRRAILLLLPTCPFFSYLPLYEMRIQPIPLSPTFTPTTFTPTAFTSTSFTSTAFTPTTFIGSPTALIAIARTSRDGDGYGDVVVPQPIELPRLLVFGDGMEVDDHDVFHDDHDDHDDDNQNHNEAVLDVDVLDADVDSSDSDSESTTSTTSHISDISSMTSVSSSSSIAKSSPAAAGVVYVPPPMRMYKLSTESTTKSSPESGLDSESEFEYESSIPSHRLPSRFQHSSKFYPIPKSQSKSSTHVNRYKYQGGETGVMTGGVMLGSTTASVIRSPFTPLASTPTRPTLARPTKRGTARTLILGPDSSSSLDWRRPRPRLRVPSVPVA